MARVSGDILIDRPVEQVFDYVADQRNEPIYNPQMLQSEKITDGPIGVGTRFRATARAQRRTVEMLIEITEYDRPRRLGSRTAMASVDVNGGSTFEPVDGATRMSWSWEVSPHGPLRLLGPLVAPCWAQAGTRDLDWAQGPARGIWPCPRLNRAVIKAAEDLPDGWTTARSVSGLRNDHARLPPL
jgi:uncharacterized protein YndB with AHSA1/START domain